MNVRLLVIVAVGLLAAALLLRDSGRGAPAPLPPARTRAARPVRPASGQPPPAEIARNAFEFGSRPAPEATPRPAPAVTLAPPPMVATPVELPVRLVGLVRRGGAFKAVLKVDGRTVEVAAGEVAGDYRVLAVDDDGVRLRAADGTVVTLSAGGS